MPSYEVSIVRQTDAFLAVQEAINLLGGMRCFVEPGETVLIKPNNLLRTYIPGTITSAGVVATLAKLVLDAGGTPIIGENYLPYDPTAPDYATSCDKHYRDALTTLGIADVPLVDLMQDEMVAVEIPGARIFTQTRVAKTALEAHKIIDVPVMKTHDQTQVSLGIKNLKGVIPAAEKKRSHDESVEQAIVDLCMLLKPALVVIDGTTAAEGMGPSGGTPFAFNLIVAGGNALATDMVGATVMGFDIARIKHLQYGVASGIGPTGLDEITVLGSPIAAVQRPFLTAESVVRAQYEEMGIRVISENACSGCWAEFRHIYYSLGEERSQLAGTTFVLGHVTELPSLEKVVILGHCARAVAAAGLYVPGCPPHHTTIEQAAREVDGFCGDCPRP